MSAHSVPLNTFMTTLCASNEILLAGSQWIISTSEVNDPAFASVIPSPIFTSIVYAVVEALCTRLIFWTPIPPAILVLSLSTIIHGNCEMVSLELLLPHAIRKARQRVSTLDAIAEKGEAPTTIDARRPRWQLHLPFLWFLQSSAATNASLLVFAQCLDMQDPSELDAMNKFAIFLNYFAIMMYTMSRFFDVYFSIATHKAEYIGQRGWQEAKKQIFHLAILIPTRIAARQVVGLSPWMARSAGTAHELFGEHRYDWIKHVQNYPGMGWFTPIASVLGPIGMLLGFWWLKKATVEED